MFKGESNGEPQRFASYRAPAVGRFDIDEDAPSGTEHPSGDEHDGLSHEADAAMHALLSGAVDLLGEASAMRANECPGDNCHVVEISNNAISWSSACTIARWRSS